jgi:hypothetical protein
MANQEREVETLFLAKLVGEFKEIEFTHLGRERTIFLINVESFEFRFYLHHIVNPNSDLFAAFLKQWEDFHYPERGETNLLMLWPH